MKILHVITGLPTAGAQMALYRLLAKIDGKRFECSVISLMDRGPVGKSIEQLGIPLYSLDMQRRLPDPLALKRFFDLVRSIPAPDIIHGWEYHGNLAASLAGWVLPNNPPVLWNVRHTPYNLRDEKWSTAWIIRLGRHLSKNVDTIVYNAEVARSAHEALGYDRAKGVVLPNGFDLSQFKPLPEERLSLRSELGLAPETLLIGLIARFHPMKDHAAFLSAAGLLAQNHPDIRFILVGEGVDTRNESLQGWIQQNGLAGKVHLLGERQDVPSLLAAIDILSLSSAWGEGFPNIVGEAMASGLPCVVTDVGDAARLVGEAGVIIPPRDSRALAVAWEKLLALSSQERTQFGLKARQRIEEDYTLQAMVKNYENLYLGANKVSQ